MTTPTSQEAVPAFPAQVLILVHLEAQKIRLRQLRVSEESDGFYEEIRLDSKETQLKLRILNENTF